jgi:hypothetical protein
MAITTCTPSSAKKGFLDGTYLAAHAYKMALIKVGASTAAGGWGSADATYTGVGTPGTGAPTVSNLGTDECAATGNYTSGGAAMNRITVTAAATCNLDFDDVVWSNATISSIGCTVFDDTVAGKPSIHIQDFGGTVSSTAAAFTVAITNLISISG